MLLAFSEGAAQSNFHPRARARKDGRQLPSNGREAMIYDWRLFLLHSGSHGSGHMNGIDCGISLDLPHPTASSAWGPPTRSSVRLMIRPLDERPGSCWGEQQRGGLQPPSITTSLETAANFDRRLSYYQSRDGGLPIWTRNVDQSFEGDFQALRWSPRFSPSRVLKHSPSMESCLHYCTIWSLEALMKSRSVEL
jgi:hypothetical protein